MVVGMREKFSDRVSREDLGHRAMITSLFQAYRAGKASGENASKLGIEGSRSWSGNGQRVWRVCWWGNCEEHFLYRTKTNFDT